MSGFIDTVRYANGARELCLGNAEFVQRLNQKFTGMNGRQTTIDHDNILSDKSSCPQKAPDFDQTMQIALILLCLLYTSDAADERSSVDLGGRRIIKKTNSKKT